MILVEKTATIILFAAPAAAMWILLLRSPSRPKNNAYSALGIALVTLSTLLLITAVLWPELAGANHSSRRFKAITLNAAMAFGALLLAIKAPRPAQGPLVVASASLLGIWSYLAAVNSAV